MTDRKLHPPSASRVAEARRAGLAPRPVLVGLGGALAGFTLCLAWLAPRMERALGQLVRAPLEAFAQGHPERALPALVVPLRALAGDVTLVSVVVLVLSGAALFIVQGPSIGWPGRASRRFDEPAPVRSLVLLAGVAFAASALSLLPELWWIEPGNFAVTLRRLLVRLALVTCALAVVDASFARAAFFRALWLTRREQRDELREAYGSPELRAARERVRRELRGGGA